MAHLSGAASHQICFRFDLPCGEQLYDRGLQRLEAMLYAVDRFAIPMKIIYINELYLIIPTQSLNSVFNHILSCIISDKFVF